MANQRHGGLGRGLGAIIPGGQLTARAPGVATLPVDSIEANPDQPRQAFNDAEMEGLVASVREHGVLQPLVVTRQGAGYRLIAGERRLRAARAAGLAEVPVVLRDAPAPRESLALALIENIQRHDLNALEEADAYRRLLEEFSLSHEEIGRQVGKSRTHVTNALRLLGLATAVQGALLSGAISAGHARAIAGIPAEHQEEALRRVLRGELNVRETEAMAREVAAGGGRPRQRAPRQQDPATRDLESQFRDALQTRVSLSRGRRGGRLVVQFTSDEELDAIYRLVVMGERTQG
ncbi:MAG: ParB/RepB/Spo0J family partition protein [Candidatus Dormibacteraeota bacterium]|nr:ParB/RepB/Spo0J family partition protein [Candidatus Dormibacteraeota bacterium]